MLHLKFTPFPTLTTDRLVLRQLVPADENEIFLLRSDDNVNEFLDRPKAKSINDARLFIEKINQFILKDECVYWGFTQKNDTKIIGTICYWNISKENATAEIGYELLPAYQGNGFIREAIEKVIRYGFDTIQLKAILADLDPANLRSIKVLEKNGFKRIANSADVENETEKTVVYSLSKSF